MRAAIYARYSSEEQAGGESIVLRITDGAGRVPDLVTDSWPSLSLATSLSTPVTFASPLGDDFK